MLFFRRFALLSVAAWTSALAAHVAIDALGDVLLPHDAYDDVAHGSRAVAGIAVGLVVALAGLWALGAALRRAPSVAERPPSKGATVAFLLAALAAAFVALVGMEALDVVRSGGRLDDLADLLGGDWRLGAAVLTGIALPVAFGLWSLAGALSALPATVAAAVWRIVRRLLEPPPAALDVHARRRRRGDRRESLARVPTLLGRAPPRALALAPAPIAF